MFDVSMSSEQFRDALQLASPAIARKGPLAILAGYLVEADREEIRVTATDLGLGIRMSMVAKVAGGGRAVYNGPALLDWVSKVGTGDMAIASKDAQPKSPTIFRAGSSRLTTNHLEADEFPRFPDWASGTPLATVGADDLSAMLHSSAIAAARDEGRPVLACVNLQVKSDQITVAAADGFRMSYLERSGSFDVTEPISLNIPRHSVLALVKLIDSVRPVSVELRMSDNGSQIMANLGPAEWVSGLVDGAFPDIRQIIPKVSQETHHEIRANADAISKAMAPILGIARDNNDLVYFDFADAGDDTSPGRIELTATAQERGDGVGVLDALITHCGTDQKRFAINSNYMVDVLNDFKGREVVIHSAGTATAVLIQPANAPDGQTHAHVVMPMVVGE